MTFFCPFSKIGPKIRKISKFRKNTEIALVGGFWWNLCQMEALGSYFSEKLKFWNFRQFYYVFQHFAHRTDPDFRKWWKIPKMLATGKIFRNFFRFFFKFCFSNFFQLAENYKSYWQILNPKHRSRVKIRNVKALFRFSRILPHFLKEFLKGMRQNIWKSDFW